MKVLKLFYTFVLITLLASCSGETLNGHDKEELVGEIETYIDYNQYLKDTHDPSIDDMDSYDFYLPENFVNYDLKDTKNVELKYEDFYTAFQSLDYISNFISVIDDFQYGNYYSIENFDSTIKVTNNNDIITIDYYEYFDDIDIISRQYFELKEVDDNIEMTRFSTTYDHKNDKVLIHKKMVVKENEYIEQVEFLPETSAFSYIYNSYEDQEYFRYKAIFDEYGEYSRETVEMYLEDYNSYVSYDIKENELEDYRVKFFENGHRVVKYDVNIFKSKETETEFTWNLLSVDGWAQITNSDGYTVFKANGPTLDDYSISIQLNGYGKVEAYKMVTGEVSDDEFTLNTYGLDSNITRTTLEDARTAFVNIYESTSQNYGFFVSDKSNLTLTESYFATYLESGMLEEFIYNYN